MDDAVHLIKSYMPGGAPDAVLHTVLAGSRLSQPAGRMRCVAYFSTINACSVYSGSVHRGMTNSVSHPSSKQPVLG